MSATTENLPMLVIDSASKKTWVGFINQDLTTTWKSSDKDASEALFTCLKELQSQSINWKQATSIAFNEGPGSMLGIRTAIMAIKTWLSTKIFSPHTKLFAYNSLALASCLPDSTDAVLIITDARRKAWNAFSPLEENPHIHLLANNDLESTQGKILILNEFNQWTQTEAKLSPLSYNLALAFEKSSALSCLRLVNHPTPLVLRESDYQKWTPRISTPPTQ